MTNSFQPSPMPNVDDISQVFANGMVEMNSQVVEMQQMLERLTQECQAMSGSYSTLEKSVEDLMLPPKQPVESTHSQLERLEEQHLQDFILEPAQGLSEQQDMAHEPSIEEDSEDEDEIIVIDDMSSPVTTPSPSSPSDDPLFNFIECFGECNDDEHYEQVVQWLVIHTFDEAEIAKSRMYLEEQEEEEEVEH